MLERHAQPDSADLVRVGVLGYGYWGPNIVSNLCSLGNCQIVANCDKNPARLGSAKQAYPHVELTTNPAELLTSPQIDAIAVITPVLTHFGLVKTALENGKHVFVEKPLTSTTEEAKRLIELADRKKLKLMVDHTYLFTGAVRKIRQLIDDAVLGDIYYYDSMRVALGPVRNDVNVVWDLAPHDLSIIDHVIQPKPEAIAATGEKLLNGLVDVAFVTAYFPGNVIAHINVNWLSPVKIRTTMIGGEKKMLVWNDLEVDEKIKVYDKGVDMHNRLDRDESPIGYRSGDTWAPRVEQTEPLKVELEYFIDCILNDQIPLNDGMAGLRVVRMLEAANESLERKGEVVRL